jgi:hypothetical protein
MNNCALEGITAALIDDSKIEQLGFSGNIVIATLGIKSEAVCAPVLNLETLGENSVKIYDDEFEIVLSDIEVGEELMTCLRNGDMAQYTIVSRADSNQKKRFLP